MPAHLSDGNRHFQQIRRISPGDPIAKLDYYLESSSPWSSPAISSSSRPRKRVSAREQSDLRDCKIQKQSSPSASSASSSARSSHLLRLLRFKSKTSGAQDDDSDFSYKDLLRRKLSVSGGRRRAKTQAANGSPKNLSPLETSGFSEGTLAEPGARLDFQRNQLNLNDRNLVSFTLHGTANTNTSSLADSVDQLAAGAQQKSLSAGTAPSSLVGKPLAPTRHKLRPLNQGFDRLKRRKINRNKRMVLIGDDQNSYMLSNPYALSELFSQSEIPGFREIFASDSYLRKFCWIVAFLFMTVLSLNDMTELITEYYDYPITVDVRLRDSARLPFPAVTVCNLNAVRFSSLCSNSRHDLTQQIPSELRDKLCGIQVEKNKNKNKGTNQDNNGSDTNNDDDINNIGVTTTTTTTLAPPTTTLATSSTTGGSPGGGSTAPSAAANSTDAVEESPSSARNASRAAKPEHRLPSDLVRGRARSGRSIGAPAEGDAARPFASRGSRVRVRQPDNVRQASASKQAAHQPARPGHWPASNQPLAGPPLASSPAAAPGQPFNVPARGQQAPLGPQPPAQPGASSFPANAAQPNANSNSNSNSNNNNNNREQAANLTNFAAFNPISSLPEDFELTERQERELQENLTNWLAVMYQRDAQLTRSLGHQFDDMILRCTMKSINCTRQRSFENSFSPTEGNCFTYRSRGRRKGASGSTAAAPPPPPPAGAPGQQRQAGLALLGPAPANQWEESNLAGTNDGLELVLNLEKNEYISGSSQVGALVMIHHPNDLGYAASEATFIAPEFTTYIGLKMVNITRLPAPYPESCVDSWPAKFADYLTRNSTYSQQACLKICLQMSIQSNCQCQSAFLPIVEAPSGGGGGAGGTAANASRPAEQNRVIICDTRKQATRLCVRDVNLRTGDRVHNCECPPKCQVVRYDKTISMARWPTREDKVSFDRGKTDVSFQNLAKVIVYFQTMTCEEVSQQAVFNAAKLFSALGGIMGMYVGFSFLSVFEIVEVISRKFWHYFTSRMCRTTSRLMGNYQA